MAAISQFPDLSPEQIALATLNYGIVVGVSQRKNSDIELNLTNHIKLKIDQFQSVDLRHSSLGISLGEFQSSSLYDLIERQAQLINIIYEDLVRYNLRHLQNRGCVQPWQSLDQRPVKTDGGADPGES